MDFYETFVIKNSKYIQINPLYIQLMTSSYENDWWEVAVKTIDDK